MDGCFAGERLLFIAPDGGVSSCPSTSPEPGAGVASLKAVFEPLALLPTRMAVRSCPLLSVDCVPMWVLRDFDSLLGKE
jgi:hypothetical protein